MLKHHVFLLQAAKKTMVGHLYYLAMQHNALLAAEKFSKCPQNFSFYLKLTDKKMDKEDFEEILLLYKIGNTKRDKAW